MAQAVSSGLAGQFCSGLSRGCSQGVSQDHWHVRYRLGLEDPFLRGSLTWLAHSHDKQEASAPHHPTSPQSCLSDLTAWQLGAPKQVVPKEGRSHGVFYDLHFCTFLLVTRVHPHGTHLGGNCLKVQIPEGKAHWGPSWSWAP